MTGDLLEAQKAAQRGLDFSELSNDVLWKINLLATLGWTCFLSGECDTALELYNTANAQQYSQDSDQRGLYSVLGVEYGTFLLAIGEIGSSQEFTKRNLARCQHLNWLESVAYCHRLLGDIAVVESNFVLAREFYLAALDIARNFGIQEQIALVLIGMAKVASEIDDSVEAINHLNAAVEIAQSSKYRIVEIDGLNVWSEVLIKHEDLLGAREKSLLASGLSKKSAYAWGDGTSLHNLGKIEFLLGDRAKAKRYLDKALNIRQKIRDPNVIQTQRLIDAL